MAFEIQTLGIVGSGNVANHLSRALQAKGLEVKWIYSRNKKTGQEIAKDCNSVFFENIPNDRVDLILICVADDAIQSIIDACPDGSNLAFTSGTVALRSIKSKAKTGVFYPMQTFTKGVELNLFEVPFFIESNDETFSQALFDLAWKISRKVEFADSETRKNMHVSAVMINNFTNHIIFQAQQYANEHNIDWKVFLPLLKETIKKLEYTSPFDAQSGPARRHDNQTIEKHLNLLNGYSHDIYKIISESIQSTYNEKL